MKSTDIARWLAEGCSDEKFAEIMVLFYKMNKLNDSSDLTRDDMINADTSKICGHIKTILDEIIPLRSETDTQAWWKKNE